MHIDEMMSERDSMQCDGLFLLFDTAKHNGFSVKPEEVHDHINECDECRKDDDLVSRYFLTA